MARRSRDWSILITAVVTGMIILVVGSIPKNLLFLANLRFYPQVPWAAVLTAGYLALFWRFLRGWDGPIGRLRANRLATETWFWALAAGALGLVTLVAALRVANRMVTLPPQQFFDVTGVSFITILSMVLVGAAAAGIVEEAAFRGFMQGPIETTHGPVVAILVTGIFFGLAHYTEIIPVLMPYYLAVAAVYGVLTYLTDSIRPAVVLHTLGNVYSSSYLWAYGHAEWQAGPVPTPLIWEVGADRSFWAYTATAIVAGIASTLAYRQLATVARAAASRS